MTEIKREIASKIYTEMTNDDLDFRELHKKKCIEFENSFKNGKLYIKCGYHVKDEVKKLGGKWDNDIKMWYITKYVSEENIKKMLKIEKSLFGRQTTIGYIEYKYDVICPKCFSIRLENNSVVIAPINSYTTLPENKFYDMSMSEQDVINIINNKNVKNVKNECMFN